MKKIFLTFLIYYFTAETNAYAYLDPASGSIIIQYIVAGIVTCMAFMKNYLIKELFLQETGHLIWVEKIKSKKE